MGNGKNHTQNKEDTDVAQSGTKSYSTAKLQTLQTTHVSNNYTILTNFNIVYYAVDIEQYSTW